MQLTKKCMSTWRLEFCDNYLNLEKKYFDTECMTEKCYLFDEGSAFPEHFHGPLLSNLRIDKWERHELMIMGNTFCSHGVHFWFTHSLGYPQVLYSK